MFRGKTVSFGIILIISFCIALNLSTVISEEPKPQGSVTGIPPKVITLDPEDDAINVPLDKELSITFSESMNQSSVEEAFLITPSVLGDFSWEGDTMKFTPLTQFEQGTPYQVRISASAMDLENETLDGNENGQEDGPPDDDIVWDFTTFTPPPQVDSHFPDVGANMVLPDADIVINFTHSMNTQNVTENLKYIVDSNEFLASTNGVTTWSNSDRTLTFDPFLNMEFNKTYEYVILNSASSTTGAMLDGDMDGMGGEGSQDDYRWSFTTMAEPPRVQTTIPRNNEEGVEVDSLITIRFSRPMDQTSVEDAFSFTHSDSDTTWRASNCNVTWLTVSQVEFEPNFDLDHEKDYTVNIEATCKSTDGVPLDGNKNKRPEGIDVDSFEWIFTTIAEPPKVVSHEPSKGESDVMLDADIVITFDKSMDTKSTEKAFLFQHDESEEEFGATSGVITWTSSNRIMTFSPDVDYQEGVTYTVTIEDTAEDADGISFEGFSFIFSTKVNSEPELTGGGVHPEKGDTKTDFTFTVLYSDEDDDPPKKVFVIINEIEYRMDESDPKEDSFIDGKTYEWTMELEEGTHDYYFEVENEKHTSRYPNGDVTRSIKVTKASGDEMVFGLFEEEYAGISTMICMPIGLVVIIALIIAVVLLVKRSKARRQAAAAGTMTFEPEAPTMEFLHEDIPGDFMTFDMAPDDGDLMNFQLFEEDMAPPVDAPPVMIQCPECGEKLKVRAARRPFSFPCKCGAKLVLR